MKSRYHSLFLVGIIGVAAATPALGQANSSLYFDGVDAQVVLPSQMLHDQTDLTLSLWVKPYRTGTIFTNHNPGSQWESVELTTNWFIINSGDSPGTRQILDVVPVTDSLWHHVACVWDGASSAVYLDGNLYAGPSDAVATPFNSFSPMRLGGPPARAPIIGYMDEVSLWSVALSEGQIMRVMRDTLGPAYYAAPDSGLIAYWRFDESSGDTVFDMTDAHNDGTIAGAVRTDVASPIAIRPSVAVPTHHRLSQNYPNPFNATTTISYDLRQAADVTLAVVDLLGRVVRELASGTQPAGSYEVSFDAGALPSGVYFYRLEAEDFTSTKRMTLLK